MFFADFAIELGRNAICFNYFVLDCQVLNTKVMKNIVTAARWSNKICGIWVRI